MAWNEPGNNGDKDPKRDPWGARNKQQPPNIDEILSNLFKRVSGGGGRKGGQQGPTAASTMGFGFIFMLLVVVYAVAGFYIVKPAEQAVVFQFGAFVDRVGPGPHWIPRFIRSKTIINVDEVSTSHHEAQMLTKDENIVSVELGVQYRIGNVEDYLFNVRAPELTLEQATDSALRQVIGHSTLDDILTSGRELIRSQIRSEVERLVTEYKAGIEILDVPMQPARAPEAVKEAFDDAIKAQEDEVRSINRARAYEKQRVPIAEGHAERRVAEAEAYKTDIVLQAKGDADRFLSVLPHYEKAPKVTRERLYLDMMESVLGKSSKIVVDAEGNNSLMYLPLDKMMEGKKTAGSSSLAGDVAEATSEFAGDAVGKTVRRVENLSRSNRWANADSRSRDNFTR